MYDNIHYIIYYHRQYHYYYYYYYYYAGLQANVVKFEIWSQIVATCVHDSFMKSEFPTE